MISKKEVKAIETLLAQGQEYCRRLRYILENVSPNQEHVGETEARLCSCLEKLTVETGKLQTGRAKQATNKA